ncbi:MAG: FkbM family methyltransferase [Thermoplasmatales archaeon]|jgi:FkbM family methyltransferase|nr:FkbM family methyltransferase [Thermoplasmatales archaeon]
MSIWDIGYRLVKINHSFDVCLRNGLALSNINLVALKDLTVLLENDWQIHSIERNLLGLNKKDGTNITCRIDKGYDFGHLIEIYIEEKYGDKYEGFNVIDVGMSNGDSSIYFAAKGAKKVVGIEPFTESFNLAVRNIIASGFENRVVPLNDALSPTTGPTVLLTYEESPNANSIDESNMVKIEDNENSTKVNGIRLEDIVSMFNGENVEVLKMDCEGCEYKVLQSVNIETYSNIEKVILEYHNGVQSLPDLLRKVGYKVAITGSPDSVGYISAERKK